MPFYYFTLAGINFLWQTIRSVRQVLHYSFVGTLGFLSCVESFDVSFIACLCLRPKALALNQGFCLRHMSVQSYCIYALVCPAHVDPYDVINIAYYLCWLALVGLLINS
jgi:hypothetical protein